MNIRLDEHESTISYCVKIHAETTIPAARLD
jgi:hypothetical protein